MASASERPRRPVHLALHKPAGVTSTVRDRHAVTTVVDLVPALPAGARLYPVGRLDQDSEGLILLTNDGDWAEHVLHPRYGVEREYAVGLSRQLTRDQAEALEGGVELAEGIATLIGLRGQTRTEDRRLDDLLEPPPTPGSSGCGARSGRAGSGSCAGCSPASAPRSRGSSASGSGRCASTSSPRATSGCCPRQRSGGSPRAARTADRRPASDRILRACPRRAAQSTRRIVVALDGPASSGKSSVGAAAAAQLRSGSSTPACSTGR